MSNLSDVTRVSMSYKNLRNRYMNRAANLLGTEEFQTRIHNNRGSWNQFFPSFQIRTSKDVDGYWPSRWMKEGAELVNMVQAPEKRWHILNEAFLLWGDATHSLAEHFFPREDFDRTSSRQTGNLAIRFVCAAIAADRLCDLEKKLEICFPEADFEPRPEPMAPAIEILRAIAHPQLAIPLIATHGMTMPMYPSAEKHRHRVEELKAAGLPSSKIAFHLGLSEDTQKKRSQRS